MSVVDRMGVQVETPDYRSAFWYSDKGYVVSVLTPLQWACGLTVMEVLMRLAHVHARIKWL